MQHLSILSIYAHFIVFVPIDSDTVATAIQYVWAYVCIQIF